MRGDTRIVPLSWPLGLWSMARPSLRKLAETSGDPAAAHADCRRRLVMSIDEKQPDANVSASSPTETPATTETAQPAQHAQPAPTAPAQPTPTQSNTDAPRPRRRGFAAMDRDRVKQIASKGGRAAHAAGTAHQFNSDEARVAGRKGGMAPHVRRGGVRRRPTDSGSPPPSQNHGQGDGR
jgi:uncharacterized protein